MVKPARFSALVQCLLLIGVAARVPWFDKALRVPLLTKASSTSFGTCQHEFRRHDEESLTETPPTENILRCPRGGATSTEDEEERYSRQVYAVGKRAHDLIRSSTVYLDGPAASGLLYETAKNLALSGIRKLVLLVPADSARDSAYHDKSMDDLGKAYQRAARAEIDDYESSDADILVEYIKRLNPYVDVSVRTNRESLVEEQTLASGRKVLVAIDRPYATQVDLNQYARSNSMSFVSMETAGVFGRIFCDFGPAFEVHDSDGETPLVTPLLRLERTASYAETKTTSSANSHGETSSLVTIHCMEGEKHDVSEGDTVRFQFRNGYYSTETCKVIEVKNPFQFVVKFAADDEDSDPDPILEKLNNSAVSFLRVKIPMTIDFVSLQDATADGMPDGGLFTACDLDKSWDDARRRTSFGCFHVLASFAEHEKRLPAPKDRKKFTSILQEKYGDEISKSGKPHIRNFLSCCAAKLSPMQAVFGAIGAQEALKAASGLYSPVRQFLLYDCDEVLESSQDPEEEPTVGLDDAGLRYILGDKVVNEMQSRRFFVVGAGAIGCEILKNLAAMGVATKGKGKIFVTDMDSIEKSNLSRQFLFRDSDIGKFKSLAAKEAVLRFQSLTKIEAHSSKVGSMEDNVFSRNFWTKKVDTVLNALDNMDARLFIDGQCVANQKALVDAGTLGPKGNVQVVVPFKSESYASSVDPPEEAIPICTLKNFPYAISHTIQWGRDLFDGFFRSRPSEASKFTSALGASSEVNRIADQAIDSMGEDAVITWADELVEDLCFSDQQDEILDASLEWAAKMAWNLFSKSIKDLLREHPLDSRDDDGELFWSGSRRPPTPLQYFNSPSTAEERVINQNLVEFVQNAARLRLECYESTTIGQVEVTEGDAKKTLARWDFDAYDDSCGKENVDKTLTDRVLSKLIPLVSMTKFPVMRSAEFEKDDDSNGHISFVNAASNLRAICYGIPPVDAMETRRIAGNIIPAMITTTAFVSAVSCIELIKLVQEAPLTKHRNAFINLALPFFAFTVPLPAEPVEGLNGREYTLWDRLFIKETKKTAEAGGLTVKSLIAKVKKLASDDPSSVAVSSISLGPYLLFANFLHEDDKSFLKSSVWDAIKEALEDSDDGGREGDAEDASLTYSIHDPSYDLTVVVEDLESGQEAELPPVCLKRHTERDV